MKQISDTSNYRNNKGLILMLRTCLIKPYGGSEIIHNLFIKSHYCLIPVENYGK